MSRSISTSSSAQMSNPSDSHQKVNGVRSTGIPVADRANRTSEPAQLSQQQPHKSAAMEKIHKSVLQQQQQFIIQSEAPIAQSECSDIDTTSRSERQSCSAMSSAESVGVNRKQQRLMEMDMMKI